jgi:predicted nucleotidyltransferase component of viral defense system
VSSGLAVSVQVRLVRHAHSIKIDPNVVLARYAAERLLYRLSRSQYADRFVLKGALMLLVWLGEAIRPTRDADLLGCGSIDVESLRKIFSELSVMAVEPDGLEFDISSLRITPIRVEDAHGGQRVTMVARLGAARLRVQVDVGVGDAVFPEPTWIEYPTLLNLPRPRLRAYRPETAIAEKLHAIVELGSKNSRMRDFFDIQALAAAEQFEGSVLSRAIAATFERRETPVPQEMPVGLSPEFANLEGKTAQWAGFVRRLPGTTAPLDFATAIAATATFAGPVLIATGKRQSFDKRWEPRGPWR